LYANNVLLLKRWSAGREEGGGHGHGYKAIKAWCAMDGFLDCINERKQGEKKEPSANQGKAALHFFLSTSLLHVCER